MSDRAGFLEPSITAALPQSLCEEIRER